MAQGHSGEARGGEVAEGGDCRTKRCTGRRRCAAPPVNSTLGAKMKKSTKLRVVLPIGVLILVLIVLSQVTVTLECGHKKTLSSLYGPLAYTHCCRRDAYLIDMINLSNALALYRLDHGAYPPDLTPISPEYCLDPNPDIDYLPDSQSGSYKLFVPFSADLGVSFLMTPDSKVYRSLVPSDI